MNDVFQTDLPQDMWDPPRLPGIRPVDGTWILQDEAYSGQMALREALLNTQRSKVLQQPDSVLVAANELLDCVLADLQQIGFVVSGSDVLCPDGRRVPLDRDDPLVTLGRLVQCDFCLHEKVAAEHVMQGAVLCFPASWTLAEKIGKPLTAIHDPVDEYDTGLAQRVQRLFDGVQVGRPLWRYNQLWYDNPALFAPRTEMDRRSIAIGSREDQFLRTERQTIFRLPRCRWVVFAIHTYVVRYKDVPQCLQEDQ